MLTEIFQRVKIFVSMHSVMQSQRPLQRSRQASISWLCSVVQVTQHCCRRVEREANRQENIKDDVTDVVFVAKLTFIWPNSIRLIPVFCFPKILVPVLRKISWNSSPFRFLLWICAWLKTRIDSFSVPVTLNFESRYKIHKLVRWFKPPGTGNQ